MRPQLLKFFNLFLIVVGLNTTLFSQTRIWVEGGYSVSFFDSQVYTFSTLSVYPLSYGSFFYGFKTDTYFNYNFAITSGAIYWENGYDTRGQNFANNQSVLIPTQYPTQGGLSNVRDTWKNSFLQVPLGLKYAPLGKMVAVSAGVDFNFVLNSKLTDVVDTLNNYVSTDITRWMPKVVPDIFVLVSVRWKNIALSAKVFSFINDVYSTTAQQAVLASDIERHAHITSFYYSLGAAPLVTPLGYQVSLGYRIF